MCVPIAATTGRWASQEESRVHARSAAVQIFNGLCRAEAGPDFARALVKTRAGDGYGSGSV